MTNVILIIINSTMSITTTNLYRFHIGIIKQHTFQQIAFFVCVLTDIHNGTIEPLKFLACFILHSYFYSLIQAMFNLRLHKFSIGYSGRNTR